MRESTQQQIEIHDTSLFGFKILIEYLYTQQIRSEELDDKIIEVLIVSDKFGCDGLKEQLEHALLQNLSFKNVCSLFLFSSQYNISTLKQKCYNFLRQNFHRVKQTKNYQKIADEVDKIMNEMNPNQSNTNENRTARRSDDCSIS
jgi:plasmid replication initiation protein